MMQSALLLVLLLGVCVSAQSLNVSYALGSNMVLQRAPAQANIWGWATPGVTVSVSFNNNDYSATARSDGSWIVSLPATAAGGPYTSSDGGKVVLANILFGDVYVCGGQSNMQFTVAQAFNASAEIAASANYPNIRIMTVGTSHYSATPLNNLFNPPLQAWSVASPASVGLGQWTGRNLYDNLQVPIGLISSNWGGTFIQAWSDPIALQQCNVTQSAPNNEANSVLYNAMIYPLQNYKITGVLWYQGEQNSGQAELYACMFPAMIQNWRRLWQTEFPFFFVQLAPYAAGPTSSWPDTRQAQLAALALPKVGYASAVDLGDPESPFGSVHPRDKQDVGKRLAAAVLSIAYGEDIIWEGPTLDSVSISQSGNQATITVTFTIPVGPLTFVNQSYPNATLVPAADCANWQVQSSDGTWHAASEGDVTGSTVTVYSTGVSPITGVAYAYASWPITTLFSEQGLPAIPFKYLVTN